MQIRSNDDLTRLLINDADYKKQIPNQAGLSDIAFAALKEIRIESEQVDIKLVNIPLTALDAILKKEWSCLHHIRWAAVDNFAEKIFQGIVISKYDIEGQFHLDLNAGCLKKITRYMPHGRSILLQTDSGIRKVDGIRGFIQTTQKVFLFSADMFVLGALSFRLYELTQGKAFDFSEFRGAFQSNSQRGMTSLIRLLAHVEERWLKLILVSPLLIGIIKGLWDCCKSHQLKDKEIRELNNSVRDRTQPLKSIKQTAASYVWHDNIRQFIPFPCQPRVTDHIQKAERSIRWDGGLHKIEPLFNQIEILALMGRGMSRLNAMQSLAKIVHSLSIRDLIWMKKVSVDEDELVMILRIKARALQCLWNIQAKDETVKSAPSKITILYASYLLWWLGMCSYKQALLFSIYKAARLTAQIAFMKEIYEIILEAIRCPDKPGFRMFYGDFEAWANDFTEECFDELLRQFRAISQNEPIKPFLDQLKNFHLEGKETLSLTYKNLKANDTQAILDILIPIPFTLQ